MTDDLLHAMQIRLRALAVAQRSRHAAASAAISKRRMLDLVVKQEQQRINLLADREGAAGNEGAAVSYRTLAEVIVEVARDMTP